MPNLSQRILTSIVLVCVVLTLIFQAPTIWFFYFLSVIVLISLYELSQLTRLNLGKQTFIVIAIVSIAIALSFYSLNHDNYPVLTTPTSMLFWALILVWWLNNLRLILNYPQKKPNSNALISVINAVFWFTPLLTLALLHPAEKSLLVLLLLIVASADSFAYFAGRTLGKHKLAPNLSSGKTIEGVIGGLFGALFATFVWMFATDNSAWQLPFISLVAATFSVVGDLYESIYKREAGVKDSGKFLPGHGGMLDRVDGLLAATPVFMLGISIL